MHEVMVYMVSAFTTRGQRKATFASLISIKDLPDVICHTNEAEMLFSSLLGRMSWSSVFVH